ncbi:hypothetical protein [Sphingomonas adhaesiva]|uniref:hypothetical protein n=1 Tax=Sphingomonas adhaesiva TaxID=28212 RepID=UPI002FF7FC79
MKSSDARLSIDGVKRDVGPEREYRELHARFRVADRPAPPGANAFLRCRQVAVEAFED